MITQYISANLWRAPKGIWAGLVLALAVAGEVQASGTHVLLGYICETFQSARQVAVHRSWERPESMPADCQILLGRPLPMPIARVVKVIEVIPVGDVRWIEIGKVRRDMGEVGYSAGVVNELRLF